MRIALTLAMGMGIDIDDGRRLTDLCLSKLM